MTATGPNPNVEGGFRILENIAWPTMRSPASATRENTASPFVRSWSTKSASPEVGNASNSTDRIAITSAGDSRRMFIGAQQKYPMYFAGDARISHRSMRFYVANRDERSTGLQIGR